MIEMEINLKISYQQSITKQDHKRDRVKNAYSMVNNAPRSSIPFFQMDCYKRNFPRVSFINKETYFYSIFNKITSATFYKRTLYLSTSCSNELLETPICRRNDPYLNYFEILKYIVS